MCVRPCDLLKPGRSSLCFLGVKARAYAFSESPGGLCHESLGTSGAFLQDLCLRCVFAAAGDATKSRGERRKTKKLKLPVNVVARRSSAAEAYC